MIHRYLSRLCDTVHSRGEIKVEHLHVGERIEATEPPDLGDVLRRIDELLYSTGQRQTE